MIETLSQKFHRMYSHQRPTPVKLFKRGKRQWAVIKHNLSGKNEQGYSAARPYATINAEEYKVYPFDLRKVSWYKTIDEAVKGATLYNETGATTEPVRGRSTKGGWHRGRPIEDAARLAGESHD